MTPRREFPPKTKWSCHNTDISRVKRSICARRFPKGERKALWCARRRKPLHPAGPDAPTPARIGTCRPKGRSHFSFGGERKVCKRKPAARRLREKGFYCPFWRRGSLCRAQHSWPDYAYHRARSELAFFRRQNGRAFFPPLPIAALLPRSWRWAYLSRAGWEVSMWLGDFSGRRTSPGHWNCWAVQ